MSISHTRNGIDLLTNMGPWRRCCLTIVSLYIISWTSFRSNRYLPNSLFFTTAAHSVTTALQWASLHVDAHPCTPFTPLPDDFLWVNPRSWALRIKDIRDAGPNCPPEGAHQFSSWHLFGYQHHLDLCRSSLFMDSMFADSQDLVQKVSIEKTIQIFSFSLVIPLVCSEHSINAVSVEWMEESQVVVQFGPQVRILDFLFLLFSTGIFPCPAFSWFSKAFLGGTSTPHRKANSSCHPWSFTTH